jgi:hypothetical protein
MKFKFYLIFLLFFLLLSCYDKIIVIKKYSTEKTITYGIENIYRTESYVTIDYRYDILNDHWGFYPTEHKKQVFDHIEYYKYINNIDYKIVCQKYDSKKNIYSKEKEEYFLNKSDYDLIVNEQFINDEILIYSDKNNERIQITKDQYEKNSR